MEKGIVITYKHAIVAYSYLLKIDYNAYISVALHTLDDKN